MKNFNYLAIGLVLSGCSFLIDEKVEDDPVANFDYLWTQCDEKYSFFAYKNIDWDEVYATYRPLVDESIPDDSLFNILSAMLFRLRDGHVNLIAPFDVSRFHFELLGPPNFDFRILLENENYLGTDYQRTGPFYHDFLAGDTIGYVWYPSFSHNFFSYDLSYVLRRYKNTRGLIFDIRSNGGGYTNNIYRLLDRFCDEEISLYATRAKSGPGHNEFSSGEIVKTNPRTPAYTKPVIVLTDRSTYSAASIFTLGARSLPNVTVIGDTTGGGLGGPNGGQLPNGWTYRFSVTQTLDLQGNLFEDGVPPDSVVTLTDQDRINGYDRVLEAAMSKILID